MREIVCIVSGEPNVVCTIFSPHGLRQALIRFVDEWRNGEVELRPAFNINTGLLSSTVPDISSVGLHELPIAVLQVLNLFNFMFTLAAFHHDISPNQLIALVFFGLEHPLRSIFNGIPASVRFVDNLWVYDMPRQFLAQLFPPWKMDYLEGDVLPALFNYELPEIEIEDFLLGNVLSRLFAEPLYF